MLIGSFQTGFKDSRGRGVKGIGKTQKSKESINVLNNMELNFQREFYALVFLLEFLNPRTLVEDPGL